LDTLPKQIECLQQEVFDLGDLVEQAVAQAVQAFLGYDKMLAKAAVVTDQKVDLQEVEVEEHCLAILADHHPKGKDLRFVVAVLKITNDLERTGDLAGNIAERVLKLVDNERFQRVAGCDRMANRAQTMLHESLQALLQGDTQLARKVIADDDAVDDAQRAIQRRIEQAIDRSPDNVTTLMQLDFVVRQLERVGDMATNIAEDVIFMVEGKIVRHESLRRQLSRPSPGRIF
jgi:phosphate transport system protein